MYLIGARGVAVPCYRYVDGQNIRIALEHKGLSDEFDPSKLGRLFEAESIAGSPLAVVRAAITGKAGVIAIASGDGDLLPLVEAIRDVGPHVFVLAARDSVSRGLQEAADRSILIPTDAAGDWRLPR